MSTLGTYGFRVSWFHSCTISRQRDDKLDTHASRQIDLNAIKNKLPTEMEICIIQQYKQCDYFRILGLSPETPIKNFEG